jgi:hypothetical protein
LGNLNNNVGFVATLLVKAYTERRFAITDFDAGAKAQGAAGIDIVAKTGDGKMIVGFQFLSLRQRVLVQNSLSPFKGGKIPNKHGPSHTNLRTARPQRRPKILSLRPFFSKPPDYVNLVQNL